MRVLLALVCLLSVAPVARACEPPLPGEPGPHPMETNTATSHRHFAAAVGLGVAFVALRRTRGVRLRSRGSAAVAAGLLLHPAWTVGVTGGDCGQAKAALSVGLTIVLGLAVAYQVGRWLLARRGEAPAV